MQGIEVLVVTLAAFFGLGILFAILMWCRSWRRDEREQTERQMQTIQMQVDRLRDAIELLDHTAASLQTADDQFTGQLEDLRRAIVSFKRGPALPTPAQEISEAESLAPASGSIYRSDRAESPVDEPELATSPLANGDELAAPSTLKGSRYEEIHALIRQGRSTLEIARDLDIGVAEVRMIARMNAMKPPHKTESKPD